MEDKTFLNGNISSVELKNNKIFRSLKPYSKTIHRLLNHLEEKGVDFVPRFLGVDEEGEREILSFVEGESTDDYPIFSSFEEQVESLCEVARMLKVFHDATLDFKCFTDDEWFLEYGGSLEKEVICHNDIAPYNMTFSLNKPVGIIDFDTACPAPRIWDIAYAVYRFVPLTKKVYDYEIKGYRDYDKKVDSGRRRILLNKFLEGYGDCKVDEVLENVVLRLEALVKLLDEECRNGNEAFIRMKNDGHQRFYVDEVAFIKENMEDWI